MVHERAMLETLREEVERQKAMRLAAARTTDGQREMENQALREEMAISEARHAEIVSELSRGWQAQVAQLEASHEAAMRRIFEECEQRVAKAAAASGDADLHDDGGGGGGRGVPGGRGRKEAKAAGEPTPSAGELAPAAAVAEGAEGASDAVRLPRNFLPNGRRRCSSIRSEKRSRRRR